MALGLAFLSSEVLHFSNQRQQQGHFWVKVPTSFKLPVLHVCWDGWGETILHAMLGSSFMKVEIAKENLFGEESFTKK